MNVSVKSLLYRPDSPIRMLLVEDSPHDADFVAMVLQHSPEVAVHIDHVTSLNEPLHAALRGESDRRFATNSACRCNGWKLVKAPRKINRRVLADN